MMIHASCAAWRGPSGYDAVLLLGPSGAGKSDFVLRLIDRGFILVADDQVIIDNKSASAPQPLAGLLEVRGLGLFKLDYVSPARLRLAVRLDMSSPRLPAPKFDVALGLPVVDIDPSAASAVARVVIALEAACGRVTQLAGAFAG